MPGEGRDTEIGTGARPFITLAIQKGSRLFDGRLPLARRKRGDRLEIDLDPVSFAALLASAGKLFTVDQVAAEIANLKQADQADDGEGETSTGEGEA
jgi:hypothetical protein